MAVAKRIRRSGGADNPADTGGDELATKDRQQVQELQQRLARYEQIMAEALRINQTIHQANHEVELAAEAVDEAKATLDEAKARHAAAVQQRDGAKHTLFRFMCPTGGEVMPLFDQMAPPDEQVHGAGCTKWRSEPISALGLSLAAVMSLTAMDIVLVGQLQDMVLASPRDWWEGVSDLSGAPPRR